MNETEKEQEQEDSIYLFSKNRNAFSIDFQEIKFNLGPAIVFYLTSVSLNLKLLQLQKKVKQKREDYNWLENVTSTVSHEMRAPLGGIM